MYPKLWLILCLSGPLAAALFQPGARPWAARAFQDLGATISVVDLPVDLRQNPLQAHPPPVPVTTESGLPVREYVGYTRSIQGT
jgi:hypothetical protein